MIHDGKKTPLTSYERVQRYLERHGLKRCPPSEEACEKVADALAKQDVPVSARQLAPMVGLSHQYVTSALHELEDMGCAVRVGKGAWVLG